MEDRISSAFYLPEGNVTSNDEKDMQRMGKKQELRRQFHFFSIWGYGVILGCAWEFVLINSILSLPNGGTAGSIYMTLIATVGIFFVTLSMAEMASISPTAGGQYHWCSELAPRKAQKFLSYYVGIFCALGWQANVAGSCYAAAQQLTAIVVLAHPDHKIQGWQTALIAWALLVVAFLFNTVLFRKMPLIEGVFSVLHVAGFFAIIVILWVMAPKGDSTTFTTFASNGWSSPGLACLVGLNGAVGNVIGTDSTVHLAEELKNASFVLPRAMIAAAGINYIIAAVMVITLMFCLGNYDDAINSATGQPFVQIIFNATKSTAGTIALTSVILVLTTGSFMNGLATLSRQLWSFARDRGLPCSPWLSRVHPGFAVPLNAIFVSIGISVCLTAISIGSTVAYNIFTSLTISGLLTSYLICIGCVLYRRNWGEPLPTAQFTLGKAGNPINIISAIFLTVTWIFQFFPAAPAPGASNMNWSVVIYGVCAIFFTLYYLLRARHRYQGPVKLIKKDHDESREK